MIYITTPSGTKTQPTEWKEWIHFQQDFTKYRKDLIAPWHREVSLGSYWNILLYPFVGSYHWFIQLNSVDWIRNRWLRYRRGVGCCDLFSYDAYIARVIARDLKVFKKRKGGYPSILTEESWDAALDEMIFGFEHIEKCEGLISDCPDCERSQKGIELFAKHFKSLWI